MICSYTLLTLLAAPILAGGRRSPRGERRALHIQRALPPVRGSLFAVWSGH